jgi:hypothetical protein
MPTHRTVQDGTKDKIVYQGLLKELVQSIYKLEEVSRFETILKTFHDLADETTFWHHQLDGLAIFATEHSMIVYKTQSTFKPLAVVADSFHIKPLYAYFQEQESFHLLALEAEKFEVYVGNIHHLESLAFPFESKITLAEVLGSQLTDNYQTNGSYGGSIVGSTFHGHGGKKDEIAIDREKYFR